MECGGTIVTATYVTERWSAISRRWPRRTRHPAAIGEQLEVLGMRMEPVGPGSRCCHFGALLRALAGTFVQKTRRRAGRVGLHCSTSGPRLAAEATAMFGGDVNESATVTWWTARHRMRPAERATHADLDDHRRWHCAPIVDEIIADDRLRTLREGDARTVSSTQLRPGHAPELPDTHGEGVVERS